MARQKGINKMEGTVDDLTYYEMNGKHYVRKRRKVSKKRLKTDPMFKSMRENGAEFGKAATDGKLLRDCVKVLYKDAGRKAASDRVHQVMLEIKELDVTSEKGKKNVGIALGTEGAKKMLKGFEFNPDSQVGLILYKPFELDMETGTLSIANLIPQRDFKIPEGATHLTLSGACADVNFTTEISALELTNEVNLLLDNNSTSITLKPTTLPEGTGTRFYFLQVQFFQMVNKIPYELEDGRYHSLMIAGIA